MKTGSDDLKWQFGNQCNKPSNVPKKVTTNWTESSLYINPYIGLWSGMQRNCTSLTKKWLKCFQKSKKRLSQTRFKESSRTPTNQVIELEINLTGIWKNLAYAIN